MTTRTSCPIRQLDGLLPALLLSALLGWGSLPVAAMAQQAAPPKAKPSVQPPAQPSAVVAEDEETSWLPEWRAIVKWTGVNAHAEEGESGYVREGDDTRQRTELSLRVQVQGGGAHWGYRLDYLNVARDLAPEDVAAGEPVGGADPFRYKPWRRELEGPDTDPGEAPSAQTFRWTHEVDHALVRVGGNVWEAILGRQPITWGSGRFWSPTDLFAAFPPLALDTEFKPGVDGVTAALYPADFASLHLVWVASPETEPGLGNSSALRARFQTGVTTEWTLVAASVRGEDLVGGSVETSFLDAGWRLEGIVFRPPEDAPSSGAYLPAQVAPRERYGYWVMGVDLQTSDGTIWLGELYRNTLGASREDEIPRVLGGARVAEGRLPQLGDTVAALAAERELSGLWRGSYALFAAPLRDDADTSRVSTLHRIALTYSVSNEAEAVIAISGGSGRSLGPTGLPRSEFGHVPDTFHLSIQFVL